MTDPAVRLLRLVGLALLQVAAAANDWEYLIPASWSELYPACGGRQQSPVNIETAQAFKYGPGLRLDSLATYVEATESQVKNTGRRLQVDGAFGFLTFQGEDYLVRHMELHFPSEHAIDGRLFPGELQIVHQKSGSSAFVDLLVISLLFAKGGENPFLKQLGLPVGAPAAGLSSSVGGSLNLKQQLGAALEGSFYHYAGSLTTPPCTESVKWLVLQQTQEVSPEQISVFLGLFGGFLSNSRPTQELKDRTVLQDSAFGCHESQNWPVLAVATWDYLLPQCWEARYPACGGSTQSPIDLDNAQLSGAAGDQRLLVLQSSFLLEVQKENLAVGNTGQGLQVDGAFGALVLGDRMYEAIRFNVRFPSEHSIDGVFRAGELQIVHRLVGAEGLAVVAVFFELGPDHNSFLQRLGLPSGAPEQANGSMPIAGSLDLRNELEAALDGNFYHYEGSLTAPPCTDSVQWFVMETSLKVSAGQVVAFTQKFSPSEITHSRPLQLRSGRSVVKGKISVAGEVTCPTRTAGDAERIWTYEVPQCWHEDFPMCAGRAQSPININTQGSFAAEGSVRFEVELQYRASLGRSVQRTSRGFQVAGVDLGSLGIGGARYDVLDFHVQCPSEHAVDGKKLACEMQVVHQKDGSTGFDDLLVLSILFEIGAENAFLKQIDAGRLSFMGQLAGIPGAVDLQAELGALISSSDFFRYDGSLTSPPCSETVSWYILSKRLTLSQDQVQAVTGPSPDAYHRPLQLVNGRGLFKNSLPGCQVEHSEPLLSENSVAPWRYLLPQCWLLDHHQCSGQRQSPININTTQISPSMTGMATIKLQHGVLEGSSVQHAGHGLQVVDAEGGVTYSGNFYNITEVHFHFLSEHAIDGRLFPGEMHLLHQKAGSTGMDDLLVAAVLYEIGAESFFLRQLGLSADQPSRPAPGSILLGDDLKAAASGGFYVYPGSLTTPPCTESVTWVVFVKHLTASPAQFSGAQSIFGIQGNNRPVQPLNGRQVGRNLDLSPQAVATTTAVRGRATTTTTAPVLQQTGKGLVDVFANGATLARMAGLVWGVVALSLSLVWPS